MKKKTLSGIIIGSIVMLLTLLILIVSTISISLIVKNINSNKNNDTVTVTFESNGGSFVEPIELNKGDVLEDLPQSFLSGSSFI